eukprot:2110729-Alexandrium_andersonii.AAC.1
MAKLKRSAPFPHHLLQLKLVELIAHALRRTRRAGGGCRRVGGRAFEDVDLNGWCHRCHTK